MEISLDQFETYAEGLDHSEDIAFDREGVRIGHFSDFLEGDRVQCGFVTLRSDCKIG